MHVYKQIAEQVKKTKQNRKKLVEKATQATRMQISRAAIFQSPHALQFIAYNSHQDTSFLACFDVFSVVYRQLPP